MWNLFNDHPKKMAMFLDGKTNYVWRCSVLAQFLWGVALRKGTDFHTTQPWHLVRLCCFWPDDRSFEVGRCWVATNDREGVTPTKEKPTYMILSRNMTPLRATNVTSSGTENGSAFWSGVLGNKLLVAHCPGWAPARHIYKYRTQGLLIGPISSMLLLTPRETRVPVNFPLHPRLSPPVDASTTWQFG